MPQPGTLYVVSTPIGNLSDLTARAAATLAEVDVIAAEDTRVTLKLLNHLGLKKPLVSYNQHNAKGRGAGLLARIAQGESAALCSDAGTPAISDPGEFLLAEAHALGLRVVPIPAASAVITALSVSGQPTGRFVFEGFITQNKRQRAARIKALQTEERTVIFYEAPHKLLFTLCQLAQAFGESRPLTLCRELTKLHEEIWVTTLGAAAARYAGQSPKGEFVLVVAGAAPKKEVPETTLSQAAALAQGLAKRQGISASDAAKKAAFETGHSKGNIYREMQK
jgi:16S rRNA (cytidine1402-2'-O)-methyltransferase